MWDEIAAQLSEARGAPFQITERHGVGGGSINQSYLIGNGVDRFFLKLNRAELLPMFVTEAAGLMALGQTRTILVPQPICYGLAIGQAYLILSYLELKGGNINRWQQLGQDLAKLHQAPAPQQFGWSQDNFIGATPQPNQWRPDWQMFFIEQRLGHQLRLAQHSDFPQGQRLLDALPDLLNHQPPVSLVHGDLWSGNAGFTAEGQPTIFDPATYYGDREVDLAMTELFGGFPAAFYQGYQEVYPLAAGYEQRKVIYNLYHILNHYHLFGGGYRNQANQMIDRILSWT